MEKSNIIISIIIVVCIAAGVAAYGITNSENPVFSNLNSMDSGSGDSGIGHGNNSSNVTHLNSSGSGSSSHNSGSGSSGSSGAGSGTHTSTGSSSGSGSSSSGHSSSGSSSGSHSSSGSSSGSHSSSGSGSGSHSSGGSSSSGITQQQAQNLAQGAIEMQGAYVGTAYLSSDGTYWLVPVYNSNGTNVDTISVDVKTGAIGRG